MRLKPREPDAKIETFNYHAKLPLALDLSLKVLEKVKTWEHLAKMPCT